MQEKTLLKIALICSITGLVFLFLVSETLDIPEKPIKEITEGDKEDNIWVKGIVNKVTEKEKVAYIEVIQPEPISVVLFKDKENLNLKQGEYVETVGKVEEYNGELQIIGNIIKKS